MVSLACISLLLLSHLREYHCENTRTPRKYTSHVSQTNIVMDSTLHSDVTYIRSGHSPECLNGFSRVYIITFVNPLPWKAM